MSRASRGFTLIEVLVALSLLAFALALTFGTLRGATRATAQAEANARRDEQLRAVQGLLRTQVGGALPIAFMIDPDSGEAAYLRGSDRKLEFVANMPGYLSHGGPYLQTLELVPGENGQRLQFSFQLLRAEGALPPEREPSVLLDGIEQARFEYRALDEDGKPGPWQTEWNLRSRLPPLVRLRLAFRDPARAWPDLVIAPRLGVAVAVAPSTTATDANGAVGDDGAGAGR